MSIANRDIATKRLGLRIRHCCNRKGGGSDTACSVPDATSICRQYHPVLVVTNYRTATVRFENYATRTYFSLETHLSKQQRRSTGPGMTESIADETHQYSQLDRIRRGYVDLTYELLCRSPYGDALGSFGIQASKKVSPPASTIEPQYSLICFKARSSNPATINASQSYNHGHTQPVE